MEYIALYIRPYKRCQYKKKFQLFLVCISYLEMSSDLSSSALSAPFLLDAALLCHPRACPGDLWIARVKLSPPLSLPDLIRQSRDSPVEPGNDEKEKKHDNDKREEKPGNDK